MTTLDIHPDLAGIGRSAEHRAGSVIFEVGDTIDAVHVVRRGVVLVRSVSLDGDVAMVDARGRGDVLDDSALLDREPSLHYDAACAMTPLELRRIPLSAFDELRSRSPEIGALLVEQLTTQVRRLSSALVDQFARSGKERAVRCLLVLHEALARSGLEGTALQLTQSDLAGFAGTTRSTLNTYLRRFEADGAITIGRGRITIVDPAKLIAR